MAIAVISSISIPFVLKTLVDTLTMETESGVPFTSLGYFFTIMCLLYVAHGSFYALGKYNYTVKHLGPFRSFIRTQLSFWLFKHDISYFHEHNAGALTEKINDCAHDIANFIEDIVNEFWLFTIAIMTSAFMFAQVSLIYLLFFVGWLALFLAFLFVYVPRISHLSAHDTHLKSKMSGILTDIFLNISTIKIFGGLSAEHDLFTKASKELSDGQTQVHKYWLVLRIYLSILHLLLFITLIGVTYYSLTIQSITVGDVILAFTLFP